MLVHSGSSLPTRFPRRVNNWLHETAVIGRMEGKPPASYRFPLDYLKEGWVERICTIGPMPSTLFHNLFYAH